MKTYTISDFQKGMIRDASLVETKPVLRTVKNYRYDYDGDLVKLQVRKGYDNFNATILPGSAIPQQLFVYRDLENNEHLLGILYSASDANYNTWYKIKEVGANPTQLTTETSTARKHVISVGGRVLFGTDKSGFGDIGWLWGDNTSITAGTTYRVGIKKPTAAPTLVRYDSRGNYKTPDAVNFIRLNKSTNRKIAFPYTPSADMDITNVLISCRAWEAAAVAALVAGAWKVSIRADDGGDPDDDIIEIDAISNWFNVYAFGYGAFNYKNFVFQDKISLTNGVKYWFVIEADDDYIDNYDQDGDADDYYGGIGVDYDPLSYVYGAIKTYNNNTGVWDSNNSEAVFLIGGLSGVTAYEYVITYLNSTYDIESRPSLSARKTIASDFSQNAVRISNYPATTDAQVDKIRIYRRDVPTLSSSESEITDTYKFVAEIDYGADYIDYYDSSLLGAELQTQDHYCFDDIDDSDDALRTAALSPYVTTVWKDRIWLAELNGNILYFSKLLEEDGRTGWVGKAIYDFFPLENKLEIPESSAIIGLKQLSDDSLVVYFKNGSVWIVEGGNDIYNPPSDLAIRRILSDTGLLAPAGLDAIRGRHVYMAQEGVFSFSGTTDPVYLSQEVQSMFDAVQTSYLDDTVIAAFGEEIWVLYDSDNDGDKDKILVLNILRSQPTWRLYDYGRAFNDIVVRPLGGTFKTVLAADALTGYVWELETGTTDNGMPIETEIETHTIRSADRIAITGVELDGYYANVPAQYQVIITEHNGRTNLFSITPKDSDDIRGHRTGCRIISGPTTKVSIQGRSVNEDKLLSLQVEYEAR